MILSYNGQKYEITNWEEFSQQLLNKIGVEVEKEIIRVINNFKLVDTGYFKNTIGYKVEGEGDSLIVYSSAPYAVYLEYGTLDYFKKYGWNNYPFKPDPKKKDMTTSDRAGYPSGMQPFAVFRRTLYNENKMSQIITNSLKH